MSYVTCDGLENVFGCRARHSLQVFSLRHWSGCRGVGEQGDWPVKQPILMESEGVNNLDAFYLVAAHKLKLKNMVLSLFICLHPNALPLSSIRRGTASPTPDTAACGGVAGLWRGQQGTGVRGHSQG